MVLDLGCKTVLLPMYYMLSGIAAPEIRPLKTRKVAEKSKKFLQKLIGERALPFQEEPMQPSGVFANTWLGIGWWLIIRTHKVKRKKDYRPVMMRGKYGRYLVELFGKTATGKLININQAMIDNGYAAKYGS